MQDGLRNVHSSMIQRCENPKRQQYSRYGGRGIKVCEEWHNYENFRKWALENGWKEGYSIDRINVNGNYEPSNCRWTTPTEQANNRRNNNFVTINGVTKTTSEWAKQIGISQNAFAGRVRNGWNDDKLLDPKYKPLKMTKAEMSKEIRMYRNLEEQGLLLRLPCKIGSILYQPTSNGINEYYTIGLCFNIPRNKFMYEVTYNVGLDWYKTTCDFDYINDVVFLTREEAENKLKEMEILKEQDK